MDQITLPSLNRKSTIESFDTQEPTDLSFIIDLLQTPPTQRSPLQLQSLVKLTKKIQFFINLTKQNGSFIHKLCCQQMHYQSFQANQYVCKFGQMGQKFYIIINGSVKVYIKQDNQMVPVSVLQSGESFGQVALLKDQPRLASIQCVSNCSFATLDKSSFKQILGRTERSKLEGVIDVLKRIPLFQQWTRKRIEKITFYFTKKQYFKRNVVFKQGEAANQVFIVKSGEFLLMEKKKRVFQSLSLRKKQFLNHSSAVSTLGPNEIFGDDDFQQDSIREFTCICNSMIGELLVIDKKDFLYRVRDGESLQFLKEKNDAKRLLRVSLDRGREFIKKEAFAVPVKSESPVRRTKSSVKKKLPKLRQRSFYRDPPKRDISLMKVIPHLKTGLDNDRTIHSYRTVTYSSLS